MPNRFLEKIQEERDRQTILPGSEYDMTNGPNDWIAIATKYLSDGAQRKGITVSKDTFRENLIKSAAVILAGLEHLEHMVEKERLNDK